MKQRAKMISAAKRGLSLLEVLITTAILATAIVFIFQAFATALRVAKFSRNISLACLLGENKLAEIEESPEAPGFYSDREEIQGEDFSWHYETNKLEELIELKLNISWKESPREKDYTLDLLTYLLPKKWNERNPALPRYTQKIPVS